MHEIKPPKLEQEIGMRVYISKGEGIGGRIKEKPEDFIVEEIMPDGRVLKEGKELGYSDVGEGEYVHFTLQKKNWSTLRAIREISKRLRVSGKRLGFAGTKDKRAVSTQRVSLWNKKIDDVEGINIRDITLRDCRYDGDGIGLGDLKGNRFTITLRGINLDIGELRDRINSTADELEAGIPNFFGVQRFGTIRPITHIVGKEIIKGDFRSAVMVYLCKTFDEEGDESRQARRFLRESGDFRETLKRLPKHLDYESSLLNHLIKRPDDYVGALRRLPKKLRTMFVHAYQSYIYNVALSTYIKREIEVEKLPLVGFNIGVDEITSGILEEENIAQQDFMIRSMPELSSRGEGRQCFIPMEDFRILETAEDEINDGRNKAVMRFTLHKGSYATSVVREFIKDRYW